MVIASHTLGRAPKFPKNAVFMSSGFPLALVFPAKAGSRQPVSSLAAGSAGGKDKFWRMRSRQTQQTVTTLMRLSPRTNRAMLSAISSQRRRTMPPVQPELCGVTMTFGSS